MASKRSATSDIPSTDREEHQSTPQSRPTRPPRAKSFPKRYKYGVDKQIPGVAATQTSPSSRTEASNPQNQPSEKPAPRRGKEKVYSSKKSKTDASSTRQAYSQGQSTSQQSEPQVSKGNPALFEIYNHPTIPREFSNEAVRLSGEEAARFHKNFDHKVFCPAVYVDLEQIKEECNLDLTQWYKQFEPLISIRASYSPLLVKVFYHCMQSDNILDSDGKLVEERITTSIRGKPITITAAYLNSILQIQNPPPIASYNYTDRQIFQLLKPDEPIPDALEILNFPPVSMPPKQRAAWYIYTRNLVQKGGNFTHFAKKDFPIFASILDQVPHNIGDWIFKEMYRFRFNGRKSSQIPFASLISIILFHEKIWYLPANEQPEKPQRFGRHILNLMRISFDEGSTQSRAPAQSRPARSRATQSRVQEAQSAPPPPSDLDARIKTIIDQSISEFSAKIESEVQKMLKEVTTGYDEMIDAQEELTLEHEALKDKVSNLSAQIGDHSISISTLLVSMASLHDKMDRILHNQSISTAGLGASSSAGPSSSIPPTNPTIPDASIAPEPQIPVPTPSEPPPFADDKGGEELK